MRRCVLTLGLWLCLAGLAAAAGLEQQLAVICPERAAQERARQAVRAEGLIPGMSARSASGSGTDGSLSVSAITTRSGH